MFTSSARQAMRPAKAIVEGDADERNGQSDKTGHDAGANRICSERRRDAAFFLDADWRLQRILQHAGETARFFFAEMPGDMRVAAINRIAMTGADWITPSSTMANR